MNRIRKLLRAYLSNFTEIDSLQIVGPMDVARASRLLLRDPVVFVDGGTRWRVGSTGISVGDGDSSAGTLDEILPVEKDYSDLAYVLSFAPQRFKHLSLFGFSGGRLDHQLCNFGEISAFLSKRSRCQVTLDQSVRAFPKGRWKIEIAPGTFSLFSLSKAKFALSGDCKYQIKKPKSVLPLSSFLLSNESHGTVSVTVDHPFFLIENP